MYPLKGRDPSRQAALAGDGCPPIPLRRVCGIGMAALSIINAAATRASVGPAVFIPITCIALEALAIAASFVVQRKISIPSRRQGGDISAFW